MHELTMSLSEFKRLLSPEDLAEFGRYKTKEFLLGHNESIATRIILPLDKTREVVLRGRIGYSMKRDLNL